jgi:hypothetical protein
MNLSHYGTARSPQKQSLFSTHLAIFPPCGSKPKRCFNVFLVYSKSNLPSSYRCRCSWISVTTVIKHLCRTSSPLAFDFCANGTFRGSRQSGPFRRQDPSALGPVRVSSKCISSYHGFQSRYLNPSLSWKAGSSLICNTGADFTISHLFVSM